jgi:hypothetical protein
MNVYARRTTSPAAAATDLRLGALTLLLLAGAPLPAQAPVEADVEIHAGNYAAWREHILPDSSEMAWEEIPWLVTFKDGIRAADLADKPLLFWTMNGHPLGCT